MSQLEVSVEGNKARLALADGLLWILLLLSPLAVGTVHVQVWVVAALMALTAFAVSLAGRGGDLPRIPRVVCVIGGLWGIGLLLQSLPLPAALLTALSPEAAAMWAYGPPTGGLRSGASTGSIHQAPGAAAFQSIRWVAACAFASACILRSTDRLWRHRLAVVVFLSVVLASLVSLIQTAAGSESILGVYVPRTGFHDIWRSPLINPNHWSAYLGMGVFVGSGLALRAEGRGLRGLSLLCGLGVLLLVLQICFGSSRGGVLGLGAGAAVFGVLLLLRRRAAAVARPGRTLAFTVGLIGVPAAAALWGVMVRTNTRLDLYTGEHFGGLSEESRLTLMPAAWRLLADHGIAGVGRDSLYDVFPRYRDFEGEALLRWMEVLPADLLLDFGWPVGLVLNLGCLLVVGLALRAGRQASSVHVGFAAALVSLAVHELGDFATEGGAVLFAAIALAVLSLTSSVRGKRLSGETETAGQLGSKPGSMRAWLTVLVSCVLVFPAARNAWLHADASRCLERMAEQVGPEVSWASLGDREWRYHPSSFPLALGVAAGAESEGDPNSALAWLNRAQLLAPLHPAPHLRTARLLRRLGARDQALVEYRLAMEGDWRGRARGIFKEVVRAYPEEEALRRLIPPDRPEALAQFAMWLRESGDSRVGSFGLEALRDLEDSPARLLAAVYARLDRKEFSEAQALIEEGWTREGLDRNMRLRLAVSMGWSGASDRSLVMLKELAADEPGSWPSLWYSLALAESRSGNAPAARRALRRIGQDASSNWRAKSLRLEADLADADGRSDQGKRLRRQAEALEGTSGSRGSK